MEGIVVRNDAGKGGNAYLAVMVVLEEKPSASVAMSLWVG